MVPARRSASRAPRLVGRVVGEANDGVDQGVHLLDPSEACLDDLEG